jgi:excisionase family DNA binding protein
VINLLDKQKLLMWEFISQSDEIPIELRDVAIEKLKQFKEKRWLRNEAKELEYIKQKRLGLIPELNDIIKRIPDDMILSPQDIAQYLTVTERQVRRYCANGELKSICSGRKYAIYGVDFKEFAQRRMPVKKMYNE